MGIKPEILGGFQQQLSDDFQRTVELLRRQNVRTQETARQDART